MLPQAFPALLLFENKECNDLADRRTAASPSSLTLLRLPNKLLLLLLLCEVIRMRPAPCSSPYNKDGFARFSWSAGTSSADLFFRLPGLLMSPRPGREAAEEWKMSLRVSLGCSRFSVSPSVSSRFPEDARPGYDGNGEKYHPRRKERRFTARVGLLISPSTVCGTSHSFRSSPTRTVPT